MSRLEQRFAGLKAAGKKGFVAYISGGDPDFDTSLAILKGLPGAGADVIELGVPFTDPAADGPSVQAAGLRALNAGASMRNCKSSPAMPATAIAGKVLKGFGFT